MRRNKKTVGEDQNWTVVRWSPAMEAYVEWPGYEKVTFFEAHEEVAMMTRAAASVYRYAAVPASVVEVLTRQPEDIERWKRAADRSEERATTAREKAKTAQNALVALAKSTGVYDNYVETKTSVYTEDDLTKPITKSRKVYEPCYCTHHRDYYQCVSCKFPEYETYVAGYEQKEVTYEYTMFNYDLLVADLKALENEERTEEAKKRLTPPKPPAKRAPAKKPATRGAKK